MLIKVDLDNLFLGRSIAWVTGHPGCTSEGRDAAEALLRVPQALVSYRQWIGKHTRQSWLDDLGDFDVRLVQALDHNNVSPVNWFESDALPINGVEVSRGLQVLAWSRVDLLDLVTSLSRSEMDRVVDGEDWSIRAILRHIADKELEMLIQPGLAGVDENTFSTNELERLEQVRQRLNLALPLLAGVEMNWEVDGEKWSGRKLLRRAAWHERDHIQQILRILIQY